MELRTNIERAGFFVSRSQLFPGKKFLVFGRRVLSPWLTEASVVAQDFAMCALCSNSKRRHLISKRKTVAAKTQKNT